VTVLAVRSSDAPGTLGFLVIFGMCVVLFFVFRSMAKHLRKVSGGSGQAAASGAGTQRSGAAGPADDSGPNGTGGPAGVGDWRGGGTAGDG
jgi:hypothetical protein